MNKVQVALSKLKTLTNRPVRVRFVDPRTLRTGFGPLACGGYDPNTSTIYLDRKQPLWLQTDTLIHEFAHHLVTRGIEHSDAWGVAYAKCYRLVHEEE